MSHESSSVRPCVAPMARAFSRSYMDDGAFAVDDALVNSSPPVSLEAAGKPERAIRSRRRQLVRTFKSVYRWWSQLSRLRKSILWVLGAILFASLVSAPIIFDSSRICKHLWHHRKFLLDHEMAGRLGFLLVMALLQPFGVPMTPFEVALGFCYPYVAATTVALLGKSVGALFVCVVAPVVIKVLVWLFASNSFSSPGYSDENLGLIQWVCGKYPAVGELLTTLHRNPLMGAVAIRTTILPSALKHYILIVLRVPLWSFIASYGITALPYSFLNTYVGLQLFRLFLYVSLTLQLDTDNADALSRAAAEQHTQRPTIILVMEAAFILIGLLLPMWLVRFYWKRTQATKNLELLRDPTNVEETVQVQAAVQAAVSVDNSFPLENTPLPSNVLG